MALLGGADEVVVRAVEPLHHGLEARHVARDQLPRRELLLRRRLQHLDAVLVGAGEEEHVVAVEPHEAGDRVGRDRLIGMADMRRPVRIGDRRGDVVAGLSAISGVLNQRHGWPAPVVQPWKDEPGLDESAIR